MLTPPLASRAPGGAAQLAPLADALVILHEAGGSAPHALTHQLGATRYELGQSLHVSARKVRCAGA
jgi:hypothetical protein